ncbi:CRISPR-associated endonuclease Cas1 [Methanobrevibacter filiformis]|uniref:CRISPR-associated endonuclease Cas1 n=1 Tax=Methanobrevibacter filiformis TaxID=55758 RepID=A0A165Z6X3_9EURY|nr:CRISPR-associated endonuclease Cas1 [Methanobrevibacter filiformis]KZX10323.1 CRISPR-associated protein Cas4/endonuclease Cas1 fusion [Methanobrevibacter filiformis]
MRIAIEGFGKSIAKRDNQIVIKEKGKEIDFFLAEDLTQIVIMGKGSITFDALRLLAEKDVDCVAIDWKGTLDYRLSPPDKKNVNYKKEQYFSLSDKRSGILAKRFIKAKIENQKAILGTLAKSRKNNKELIIQKDKLKEQSKRTDKVPDKPVDKIRGQIFGIEGQAAIEYWKGFKEVIDPSFQFYSRSGRYAQDPVNAMLNYGYAIIQGEVWRNIHLAGLDPYCGFLHSDRKGRTSLVFDIMEEFRQQIVDKTVLSLLNKKQVQVDGFKLDGNLVLISDSTRRLLVSSILSKLSSKIQFNGKNMKYSDIILHQARLINKFLEGKEEYTGFSLRW